MLIRKDVFSGYFGENNFSSADDLIHRLNLTHFSQCHYFTSGTLDYKSFLYCTVLEILGGLCVIM